MKRQIVLGCSLAVLSVLLTAAVFAQGFYFESTRSGNSDVREKMYYMPKMFKSVDGDNSSITILRFDTETMYHLNPAKKTYNAMTFAEMKAMVEKARSMGNEKMAQHMASLPPDQQEKMKEMMKKQSSPSTVTHEVVPAGEHKTISGYVCDKYIVKRNGKESETIWASKQVTGYESMKHDMGAFLDKMSGILGTNENLGTWFQQIDGFPIQTDSHGSVNTVTKIDRKSIPASEFEVPGGYTREKSHFPGETGSGE